MSGIFYLLIPFSSSDHLCTSFTMLMYKVCGQELIKSHLAVCVSGGTQSSMVLLERLLRLWHMMHLQVSISDLYCS